MSHAAVIHCAVIGDQSLIGIGAILLNGAQIGRSCIVGAGVLVTEGLSIPDGSLVIGHPAKVVRQLSAEEQALLLRSAHHCADNRRLFKTDLKLIG